MFDIMTNDIDMSDMWISRFPALGLVVLFAGSETCFVVILEKEVEMDLR